MKKTLLFLAIVLSCLEFTYGQPGRPDSSFGTNGNVSRDFGEKYKYSGITTKILSQPDGSIYAIVNVSGRTVITKRFSNGSLDSSYGHDGLSSPSDIYPVAADFDPDGKIVVAGGIGQVVRYNIDGTIDKSFSPLPPIPPGPHDEGFFTYFYIGPMAVQTDGKIVLAGTLQSGRYFDGFVKRVNTDGSIDSTFSVPYLEFFHSPLEPSSLVIQPDGKILVAGDGTIIRCNTDGSPDSTFDEDGNLYLPGSDFVRSIAVPSDKKIVAKADISGLLRYNADGSVDSSFSRDGKQETDISGYHSSVTIDDNNRILVTGSIDQGRSTLARYNTDGSLDLTFNKNGVQNTDFSIVSVAMQDDGKIVAAGLVSSEISHNLYLARYNTDGNLDLKFGKEGKLTDDIRRNNTVYTNGVIQKDGKIVSVGRTWNGNNFDFIIVRYKSDGSTDSTFNGTGTKTTDFASQDDYAYSVAIQSDGKLVVGGNSGNDDSSILSLARYNTDGSLDNTFKHNGTLSFKLNNSALHGAGVIIQSDGKILATGDSVIMRLNGDGSFDNTFNGNGILKFSFAIGQAAIQNDGKIVVAAAVYQNFSVIRLNRNGSLDNTFSDDGIQTIRNESEDYYGSYASSVTIQKDGKIVVGGTIRENIGGGITNEVYFPLAHRFNSDGSFDNTFSFYSRDRFSTLVTGLEVTQNRGIIVETAGEDYGVSHIYRIKDDGKVDSTFEDIRGTYTNIKIADDKLYAVGSTGPFKVGLVARYLLDDSSKIPPTVTLTHPTNNATRLAPANIQLNAAASDADGTVSKVEFYNSTHLLQITEEAPYEFKWRDVHVGNYTITAKAYDNTGLVTTSAPVHISVVPNKPPIVSIIKPVVKQTVAAPGYIHFEADASDVDGRIARVEFYNGSTLIRTEYYPPYTYVWKNVQKGTYTITAVAIDNWAARTTSEPVTIRVVNPPVTTANKPSFENHETDVNSYIKLTLAPNPADDIITINTEGLKTNVPATISVISASGVEMKVMQIKSSTKTVQLDVSKLVSGVYTMKMVCRDKILYRQFVKL